MAQATNAKAKTAPRPGPTAPVTVASHPATTGNARSASSSSQAAPRIRPAPGDPWPDPSVPQRSTVGAAVVGLVGVELGWQPAPPTSGRPDRRNVIDHGGQQRPVGRVGRGDRDRQGQAGGIGHQVQLGPWLAAVDRIGTNMVPPRRARTPMVSTPHHPSGATRRLESRAAGERELSQKRLLLDTVAPGDWPPRAGVRTAPGAAWWIDRPLPVPLLGEKSCAPTRSACLRAVAPVERWGEAGQVCEGPAQGRPTVLGC